ncbi:MULTISPECIES: flagellar biosynthetic protein FliR [unclassified Guyparkeria]|uniref:flagellar biosynthetic protein FliR n=1 Tax=unclassified Guyparkeria TaxID=2626246 RepID=UPI00073395EB|nr:MULTISPECIES: flagellar biosynthetic protein FliR [unclassified Guyparkeria]KTG16441.1 flagellar biosynthetic protein FliR [Guyparkeria sp. XI15]OAE85381.1 flagellar biosynthetic protein FliR [Guyparkeria sp. WRN-7]
MELAIDQILTWAISYLWVLIRVGAMLMVAPIFGSQTLPTRVRLLIALVVSVVITPMVPDIPSVDPLSVAGFVMIVQQILIGVAMGFVLNLVLSAFVIAGESIAMSMGLGFAQTVDPQNGVSVPLVSQFLTIVVTLLMVTLNVPGMIVKMLADSFTILPISPIGLTAEDFRAIAWFGQQMYINAVLVALPIVTTLLMVNLAMGVITRAAPQMNIFSVGFPATLMIGFFLLFLAAPLWFPNVEQFVQQAFVLITEILR